MRQDNKRLPKWSNFHRKCFGIKTSNSTTSQSVCKTAPMGSQLGKLKHGSYYRKNDKYFKKLKILSSTISKKLVMPASSISSESSFYLDQIIDELDLTNSETEISEADPQYPLVLNDLYFHIYENANRAELRMSRQNNLNNHFIENHVNNNLSFSAPNINPRSSNQQASRVPYLVSQALNWLSNSCSSGTLNATYAHARRVAHRPAGCPERRLPGIFDPIHALGRKSQICPGFPAGQIGRIAATKIFNLKAPAPFMISRYI